MFCSPKKISYSSKSYNTIKNIQFDSDLNSNL